jgi:biopolymer transport protein ExbB/TolQ
MNENQKWRSVCFAGLPEQVRSKNDARRVRTERGLPVIEQLMGLLNVGEEWVIYLLLGTSVVCIAITLERIVFLARFRGNSRRLKRELRSFLAETDIDGARRHFAKQRSIPATILTAALESIDRSPEALSEMIDGEALEQRSRLERGLDFLGTVGSNAPFVGLFGTVLGIIQAFHALANAQTTGPQVVMAGISSALVATAVGLMVAIPALIAFNVFKGRVRDIMRESQVLCKPLLSFQLDRALGCAAHQTVGDTPKECDANEDEGEPLVKPALALAAGGR